MNNIFSIILPAYNEEQSISRVVREALDARDRIAQDTGLQAEIIVVNDGSSDRTGALLAGIDGIVHIDHPANLGYGVALRTGIAEAKGDLIGFHDADGTCRTAAFVAMIHAFKGQNADMVIGVRTASGSHMPVVRKLGNRIFAGLISTLCGTTVTDSATGMRVFTKDLIRRLYPLPDGLHFTPVMTAKTLLEGLKIAEIPIPYAEREGRSKLSVFKDGFRFLFSILGAVKLYEPVQLFGLCGGVLIALGLLLSIGPVVHYLSQTEVREGYPYRLLAVMLLVIAGALVLSVGAIAQLLVEAVHGKKMRSGFLTRNLPKYWIYKYAFAAGCVSAVLGLTLLLPGLFQYLSKGVITYHWSYFILGGLLAILGTNLILLKYLLSILLELLAVLKHIAN